MTVASITRPARYRKRRSTEPSGPQQDNIVTAAFAAFGLPPNGYYNGMAGNPNTLLAGLHPHINILQNGTLTACKTAEYPALLPTGEACGIAAFSRLLNNNELLLIYNTAANEAKEKFITISYQANTGVQHLLPLYGFDSSARIHVYHAVFGGAGACYIKVYLKPMQLVILKNF